eukprot:Gregarina_sp_Poly_1__6340@NODE_3378_length_1140_cov_150_598322_g2137_i0_p1_GENE_NODE_3378_length_1140_cov_150_598322_g2137_i0NODE_3378_length_1140_cov_150_598322_g2137_i0_p1_ORF_typecomplete_len243_score26_78Ras/PF00071_22/2_2e53Roc/PF08477_13/4_6e24Arf/PF00025_21/8_4e17SRPRB/PF09439_10/1_3e06GTP_EFTU/PF00009_27/1_5e05Gtr1_RagA/PF04670_12/6_2e06FeoB_N/PF02421_18/3_4e05MMR_HSR1/PF01926_23/0_00016AAA_22/PF13401_6/0_0016PduVEutP/PF10662_9/0_012TniB/PF05621_11/0_019Septin/PF00735_18/0_28_NODE_3378_l
MGTAVGGQDYDSLYKIILVGDATVGKTHLISRYSRNTLPKGPIPTVGVEFTARTIDLPNGTKIRAQIWDTAGQERYRSIVRAHYRRAVGALLVYDVTRKQTFLNAAKWLEDVRQYSEPDIVVMLVGNKHDMVDRDPAAREVPYEMAAQFAHQNGLLFFEASAISMYNVKNCFESVLIEIYNQRSKTSVSDSTNHLGPGIGPAHAGGFGDGKPRYPKEMEGGLKLEDISKGNEKKEEGCCSQG